MDLDLPLQQGWILDFALKTPSQVSRSPVSEVGVDWNVYPVSTVNALLQERQQTISKEDREQVLGRQGPIWGDDELLAGLNYVALNTGPDQFVHVWDPLLLSGLVVDSHSKTWSELIGKLGVVATVISAVAVDNHWYPVLWRLDSESTKLFTCGVPDSQHAAFNFLSSIVGVHRTGAHQPWKNTALSFVPTGHCGALVLSFVRHLLWGSDLVVSQEQLECAAGTFRVLFVAGLSSPCHRPRLAALGLEPLGLLGDMLQKHGVAHDEVTARVDLIRRELGDEIIAKVVQTGNPWQELKWHANQKRPPLVLIRPSELQKTIAQRADKQIGSKRHKQSKGKGKGKPGVSMTLDPMMLRLDSGVFQSKCGQHLSQVALTGLSVGVSGVVLTTMTVAKPYLQAGKTLSTGALGFLLLDGSPAMVSGFAAEAVRVPLVCAANSEPLLVDACLVQMGAVVVERVPAQVDFAVKSVPTCVVKAMIYRDLTQVDWQEVVAHPLRRHIFDLVPPLQVCPDAECLGCESWHSSPQYPIDGPVVEVWSKQWLKLNFVACAPTHAEGFCGQHAHSRGASTHCAGV